MKFKLWLYISDGYSTLAVEDTSKQLHQAGAWMLRDQSIYQEDNGRLVWKRATYPASVKEAVRNNDGVCIAESDYIECLNVNMKWSEMPSIWER